MLATSRNALKFQNNDWSMFKTVNSIRIDSVYINLATRKQETWIKYDGIKMRYLRTTRGRNRLKHTLKMWGKKWEIQSLQYKIDEHRKKWDKLLG
jgi:hypothetical protein